MQSEHIKVKRLKQHKLLATGLFVFMVVLYGTMVYLSKHYTLGWISYVKAFSEAAMVGALADWFAVTALFYHPLGLPIPHTNLIEKSKKTIGDNLGSFVVNNFLTPKNIKPYIAKLSVAKLLSGWLQTDKNRQLVVTELRKLLADIAQRMDDSKVSVFITKKANELIQQIPMHVWAGNAMQYFVNRGEQDKLVTLLAGRIKQYIKENESMVQEKVSEESYFFVPKFVDKKLGEKIAAGLVRYFEEIEKDLNHKIRKEIADQLIQLSNEFIVSEKWKTTFDNLKKNILQGSHIEQYSKDIWQYLKLNLNQELEQDNSSLVIYGHKLLANFADNLNTDKEMGAKIDNWIKLNAYKYLLRNTHKVATLISSTVGNWQGRELSQKLELEVGKDLQFIRINGTIVGGLVGLLIHTITNLLS